MSCSSSRGILSINGQRLAVDGYLSHLINSVPGQPGQTAGAIYRITYTMSWRADFWGTKITQTFTGSMDRPGPVYGSFIGLQPGTTDRYRFVVVAARGETDPTPWNYGESYPSHSEPPRTGSITGITWVRGVPNQPTPSSFDVVFSTSFGQRSIRYSSFPTVSFLGCVPSIWTPKSSPGQDWRSPEPANPYKDLNGPNGTPWNPSQPPPSISPGPPKPPPFPDELWPPDFKPLDDPGGSKPPPDDDKKCCCPSLIPVADQIIWRLKRV